MRRKSLPLPRQFGSASEKIPATNWFKIKPRKKKLGHLGFFSSGCPAASPAGARFTCRNITCLSFPVASECPVSVTWLCCQSGGVLTLAIDCLVLPALWFFQFRGKRGYSAECTDGLSYTMAQHGW